MLLLDFDGPVAHLFAGRPAPDVAADIRRFATHHDIDLSGTRTDDPLMLLRAAYRHSAEAGRDVEAHVIDHEARAATGAAPTPGAHDLIRVASATRPVLIVSNNSERAIRIHLARHGLTEHVAHIIGRPFGHPEQMKPDPYLLRAALDVTRTGGSESVFVGDSITDVIAGTAAGVPCIGYATHPQRGDGLADADAVVVVDDMRTLSRVID
ncbi:MULTISPECIES: HAD family hydrolase [unclassified Pseudonocardia]|uniref:HAD family hydrolase n=1 Tax=unclassified Pseudonocardia TaxID=2619320 RepID=UPI001482AC3A|nr:MULTISPECIES: HAD family hydrolase [unclassified Pseudonocardia]